MQYLAVLLCALALSGLGLGLPPQVRILYLGFLDLAFSVGAIGFFARKAREQGPFKRFFLGMALALGWHLLLALVRQAAGGALPWLGGATPIGILLDSLGPLVQALAILRWPVEAAQRSIRFRKFLDALLFATSIFLFFWLFGLGDTVRGASIPPWGKVAIILFFADYTLLMGLALYQGLDTPGALSGGLGWLLAAFALACGGNLSWIFFHLRGVFHPAHPLNALQPLIPALYLLAALAPSPAAPGPASSRRGSWGDLVLPILPFLLVLPLATSRLFRPSPLADGIAIGLGLGMVLVLLVRQFLAVWDAHHFSRTLENQVRERTQALENSQKMLLRVQRLNIMETLSAGLAHDLKNLLSVVMSSSFSLEEDLAMGVVPTPAELGNLRAASYSAGELLAKLTACGREAEPELEVFDLRERVRSMTWLVDKVAAPTIEVAWDLGDEALFVEMEMIQVEQCVINLVTNAKDAMPNGGLLTIRTAPIDEAGKRWATLEIADSGSGIPEANLPRVFDPFFTTKELGKGTGLGLASVKSILDHCGGRIEVRNRLGAGTVFTLSFPRFQL